MESIVKNKINNICRAIVAGITGALVVMAFHSVLMKVMLNSDLANSSPSAPMFFTALVYVITGVMASFVVFIFVGVLLLNKNKKNDGVKDE